MNLKEAAPHHQEMNGIYERMWQTSQKMAFSLCTHVRVGWPFLHQAQMCACCIMDVSPVKGCCRVTDNKLAQSNPMTNRLPNRQVSCLQLSCNHEDTPKEHPQGCKRKVNNRDTQECHPTRCVRYLCGTRPAPARLDDLHTTKWEENGFHRCGI